MAETVDTLELTADELQTEILGRAPTDTQETLAYRCFQAMPFGTTTLLALEAWLRSECEDATGADLVHACAVQMAQHEASIV